MSTIESFRQRNLATLKEMATGRGTSLGYGSSAEGGGGAAAAGSTPLLTA